MDKSFKYFGMYNYKTQSHDFIKMIDDIDLLYGFIYE